jgi:hypothetical protein
MTLPLSLALIGLVVDIGWANWRKEACYSAAQSAAGAAIAAAQAIGSYTCGTATGQVPCGTDMQCPSSLTTPTNPLQAGCLYAQQNGFTNGANRRTVTASAGTTGTILNATPNYWITFTVTEQLPQTFSAVMGNTWANVAAAATGGVLGGQSGGCIYVMQATGTDMSMSGGTVASNCGVYLNSTSSSALTISGGCIATSGSGNCSSSGSSSAKTDIHGGYSSSCSPITNCVLPAPVTSATAQSDPFASLAVPSTSGMTTQPTVSLSAGSLTINPGIYTSAITVSAGTLTLKAGVYYLQGGISLSGGTIKDDNLGGVTLYNTSGSMAMSGGTCTLHATSSGTYQGILLFQSRTNSSGVALSGGPSTYTGAVYAIDSALSVSGGTYTSSTFVVNTFSISGGNVATINGSAVTQLTGAKLALLQ